MAISSIPSHRSDISETEINAVVAALQAGHLTGDGPVTKRVQTQLRELTGAKHVLLTTSGTHAIELALMAAGIGPGDEVILPSFTFSSTANAVVLQGARPVFAEVEMPTLTLDPNDVERRITPRTKAILPVHYAGVAARMEALLDIATRHHLSVIEDAAQGVGATYNGQPLGTLGLAGCYSFHGTKNFTCGEGGALITNDETLARRAEIMREKGTNRQAFFRGEVDKYTWVDRGSSFVLSDVLAALLGAQLSRIAELTAQRRAIHDHYQASLLPLAQAGQLTLPVIPETCQSNYHLYFVLARTLDERNRLLHELKQQGIGATFHYVPLHSSPYGRQGLGCEDELPVTEDVSARLLRLPLYPALQASDVERVIAAVQTSLSQ